MKKMSNENLHLTAVYKNVYRNVLYLKLCEKNRKVYQNHLVTAFFFFFFAFYTQFFAKRKDIGQVSSHIFYVIFQEIYLLSNLFGR